MKNEQILKNILEEFKEEIIEKTHEFKKRFTEKIELSEKAQRIKKLLRNTDLGCARTNITEVISELLGEDITKENRGYIRGAMIVLTENPNGHDYPLNEPILVLHTEYGFIAEGYEGNSLPRPSQYYGDCIRVATREEINEFFESLNYDRASSYILDKIQYID
jgi:hypothetical protein